MQFFFLVSRLVTKTPENKLSPANDPELDILHHLTDLRPEHRVFRLALGDVDLPRRDLPPEERFELVDVVQPYPHPHEARAGQVHEFPRQAHVRVDDHDLLAGRRRRRRRPGGPSAVVARPPRGGGGGPQYPLPRQAVPSRPVHLEEFPPRFEPFELRAIRHAIDARSSCPCPRDR